MSKSTTTLKKIAETAGVSITTVHRVLNGKEGCGEELKERILTIAKEQGYEVNYMAASLRKKPLHIALVFPKSDEYGRFFVQKILNGYFKFREEAESYHILFQEYYYPAEDTAQSSFYSILNNIYQEKPFHYDGIIIYNQYLPVDAPFWALMNRMIGKKIPVVIMEKCPDASLYSCLVGPDEDLAGKLAAELMSKYVHRSGTIALIGPQIPYPDMNVEAFSRELERRRKDLVCQIHSLPLLGRQRESLGNLLAGIPDLAGVYCTCARHTLAYLENAREQDFHTDCVIGSELFEESCDALQSGTLDAVIDKKPFRIGFEALRLLFNHLVKNEPLPLNYPIYPKVILQTNSLLYLNSEEK